MYNQVTSYRSSSERAQAFREIQDLMSLPSWSTVPFQSLENAYKANKGAMDSENKEFFISFRERVNEIFTFPRARKMIKELDQQIKNIPSVQKNSAKIVETPIKSEPQTSSTVVDKKEAVKVPQEIASGAKESKMDSNSTKSLEVSTQVKGSVESAQVHFDMRTLPFEVLTYISKLAGYPTQLAFVCRSFLRESEVFLFRPFFDSCKSGTTALLQKVKWIEKKNGRKNSLQKVKVLYEHLTPNPSKNSTGLSHQSFTYISLSVNFLEKILDKIETEKNETRSPEQEDKILKEFFDGISCHAPSLSLDHAMPSFVRNKTAPELREWLVSTKRDIATVKWIDTWALDLMGFPKEITYFSNITMIVDLSQTTLARVARELSQMKTLETIQSTNCSITMLPPEIRFLTQIKTFALTTNQLTEVNPEIGSMTSLTRLYLDRNQLTTLPENMTKLTNLTELYLNQNQFRHRPEFIKLNKMTRLKTLWMQDNPMRYRRKQKTQETTKTTT